MARRLGETPLRELLPGSIAEDPTIRAAAEALDTVLDAATRAVPSLLLYARLAHDTGFVEPVAMLPPLTRLTRLAGGLSPLSAGLLDQLAWQLHVESYEAAVDEDAKRRLIAGSLLLHRRRGTPWAVRTALETALHTEATIKEWFNYGGKPYYFRVRLDVSDLGMDEHGMTSAVRLILDYKNVRSWLDCLETFTRRPLPVAVATAGIMRTLNRVRLWFPPRPVPPARVHVAVAGIMRSSSRLCPFTPPQPVPAARGRVALALLTMTRSRACPQP